MYFSHLYLETNEDSQRQLNGLGRPANLIPGKSRSSE
jgi:hypothetical protein